MITRSQIWGVAGAGATSAGFDSYANAHIAHRNFQVTSLQFIGQFRTSLDPGFAT
jgi:hypothetical protein